MRTSLFLATILALAPMPALADVTAHYAVGNKELVVEVDDGGNSRIDMGGQFSIIRRDGTDYIAITDKDGPKVFELQAMVDLLKTVLPKAKTEDDHKVEFGVVPGPGNISVAGVTGSVWLLSMLKGPADDVKRHVEIAMSPDPKLAPVGQLFARTADIFLEFMGNFIPESTQFGATTRGILAKGTPLRILPIDPAKKEAVLLELKSVETSEIDAKHFELPAPVTSTDEIFGAMDSLMKPGGAIQNLP